MKQSTTRNLFSYWNKLRAGRMAPERDAIDPAAIPSLLLDTFILEVDPGRTLPVRVAGARMASLFTRELKGLPFTQLFGDDDRDCLAAIIESVLDEPTPAVAGVSAAPPGRAPLDMELLLLPLRHHGKTHARILGALTPSAIPGWLGLVETAPLNIVSLRVIHPVRPGLPADTLDAISAIGDLPLPANHNRTGEFVLRVLQGGRAG
jgi:hypothetical protein